MGKHIEDHTGTHVSQHAHINVASGLFCFCRVSSWFSCGMAIWYSIHHWFVTALHNTSTVLLHQRLNTFYKIKFSLKIKDAGNRLSRQKKSLSGFTFSPLSFDKSIKSYFCSDVNGIRFFFPSHWSTEWPFSWVSYGKACAVVRALGLCVRDEGRLSIDETFRDREAADGHCSTPYSALCPLSVSAPTLL